MMKPEVEELRDEIPQSGNGSRKSEVGFGISDLLFRNRVEGELGAANPHSAIRNHIVFRLRTPDFKQIYLFIRRLYYGKQAILR